MPDFVVVRSAGTASRLPFLIRFPLGEGALFRTSAMWPHTHAVFCYPAEAEEWPDDPDIVDRTAVRSCVRHEGSIVVELKREHDNRAQIVFTTARGRNLVFWQSLRCGDKA